MSAQATQVSPQQILDHLWSARAAMALAAGVELDVFNHIEEGKTTVNEIARAAKASQRGMRHLLDALTGMGYLTKKGDRYGNGPVASQFLVKGKPGYMGGIVGETRQTWPGWAKLPEVVQTGKPISAVDTEDDAKEFFPKLVEAIFPMSYGVAQGAVQAIPEKARKRIKTILDVAAGSAAWSLPFAQANPDVRVTVVDYPEVTPVARRYAERFGVADRYDYIEGNLREVNYGRNRYDLAILGHIIHSEGEKWGKKLIKQMYRILTDNGMLLIAEMIPNDTRSGPMLPLLFGLNMLVHTEAGDVFTMREYRKWLKEAGFRKVQVLDVPGPSPLILATK
jgi:ubiquinone/menaquinone biosynthesis C-methylase UbiE/DNA-binding transcriptional ArsR family regulator